MEARICKATWMGIGIVYYTSNLKPKHSFYDFLIQALLIYKQIANADEKSFCPLFFCLFIRT